MVSGSNKLAFQISPGFNLFVAGGLGDN